MLPKVKSSRKTVYLDHAATTYLDPRVIEAMEPFWAERFGNPASLYGKGREAGHSINIAREKIAKVLNCRADEIIFCAGGTESINMAIFGVVREYQSKMRGNPTLPQPHIITSEIEHHAVLHSLEALQKEGVEVSYVPVDPHGFVRVEDVTAVVKSNTILCSIMYANNEIGTVEPISAIGAALKKLNAERLKQGLPKIFFHTDACQAGGVLDMDIERLNVDMATINGSKMYGPKQTGILYLKTGTRIRPLIYGGGQERNLRSGTENVPGIVGFAVALELAQSNRIKENARLRDLRAYLWKKVTEAIPKIVLNGPPLETDSEESPTRLPNNINVSILDIEGEALLLYLDSYNICMSTGSACTSTSLDPSHVILAIGRPYEYAHGSMRFTLGKVNTKKDIDYLMSVMPDIVKELRRISPVNLDLDHPTAVTAERAFIGENMDKFRNKKVTAPK